LIGQPVCRSGPESEGAVRKVQGPAPPPRSGAEEAPSPAAQGAMAGDHLNEVVLWTCLASGRMADAGVPDPHGPEPRIRSVELHHDDDAVGLTSTGPGEPHTRWRCPPACRHHLRHVKSDAVCLLDRGLSAVATGEVAAHQRGYPDDTCAGFSEIIWLSPVFGLSAWPMRDLDGPAACEFRTLYARPREIPGVLLNTSGPILCPPLVESSPSASGSSTAKSRRCSADQIGGKPTFGLVRNSRVSRQQDSK